MRTIFEKPTRNAFRKDETGSLVIFSLFIFILLLMMAGMAVDLVRHEQERVKIQNTIDTAVVAASSLTQGMETKAEVTALVKDHMAKAGLNPDMVIVDSDTSKIESTGEITSRWVNASVDWQMDTMFMNMMGIDSLPGGAASGAREGTQKIEIAMVLDVSGSMNGAKLDNLKIAAKQFVTTVLSNNTPEETLISIIPYSQQVHMSDDLMARLNLPTATNPKLRLDTVAKAVAPAPTNPNAVATYVDGNMATNCVRFRDEDFDTRSIVDGNEIELLGHFRPSSTGNYSTPSGWSRWCRRNPDPTATPIKQPMLLFQNDESTLHTHIDSLSAGGWTAIDYGMNWGVGVLDPAFQDVVTGMIADSMAPASAAGFPVEFGTPDVLKYVVLLTDGINTRQRDLKDAFKSGPTRVWYSSTQAGGDYWDGFLVEMPDNAASQRWYVPGSPWGTGDDYYLADGSLPTDAIQWTHHDMFDRFSPEEAADYFFEHSDSAAHDAYDDAVETGLGYNVADDDTRDICAQARTGEQIEIFTIAFEAPSAADALLAECSAKAGNHFDASVTNIASTFSAIAAEITKLRLTQ